jgi:hypothetical protein
MFSHRRPRLALPALLLAAGVLAGSPAFSSSSVAAAETNTVSGTVTDVHGAPIAHVQVHVWSPAGAPVAGSTYTDASGVYSLGLAAGSYLLYFIPPNDAQGMGWWSATGFTYSMTDAGAIDLTAGDAPGTDLVLPDAIYISGTVTTASSVPIAGIQVTASRREGDSTWFYYGTTDAAGAYRVDVPPAAFTVSFTDPTGVYPFVYYSTTGVTVAESAASVVTVASTSVSGIDATLTAGLHITGTVTDTNGLPLKEITVRAYTADLHELGHTWTDADGKYSLPMLQGSYLLMFEEYTQTYLSGYWSASGPVYEPADAGTITLSEADVTADIQLPPWAPRPDPTAPAPNPTLPPTSTAASNAHSSGLPLAAIWVGILAIIFLAYRRFRRSAL